MYDDFLVKRLFPVSWVQDVFDALQKSFIQQFFSVNRQIFLLLVNTRQFSEFFTGTM